MLRSASERVGWPRRNSAADEWELPAPTTPTRLLRPGESERLRSLRPGDRASSGAQRRAW
jgi:hypothetical protein